MIKSREVHLVSTGDDTTQVLAEAMEFGRILNLSSTNLLKIRLLTEETMSILRTLTGEINLDITFIEKDGTVMLNVETDTFMDATKRADLLSLSQSGVNSSAKGILGRIRDAFEMAFAIPAGVDVSNYTNPAMMMGVMIENQPEQVMDTLYWSLAAYKDNVEQEEEKADLNPDGWDLLEKSIISSIADDVQIGIRGDHVVMAVIYKLKDQ